MAKFSKKTINISLMAGFFVLRISSFLLVANQLASTGLALLTAIILIVLFLRNRQAAFFLLLAEIIIGGAGVFWQFFNLSLTNFLIVIFLLLYFGQQLLVNKKIALPKLNYLWPGLFLAWLIIAALIGWRAGNSLIYIYQDLSPFLLLFLFFPAKEFLTDKKIQKQLLTWFNLFLWAEAVWTAFNFVLFRWHLVELHQPYYNWLRDVGAGKITEVTISFWRVVFPEHLLVVPLMLIFSALWLKTKNKFYLAPILAGAIILSFNISRAYLLGWVIGLLVLKLISTWKNWLKICALNLGLFAIIFCGVNLVSSNGQSLGLNMLGLRFLSTIAPQLGAEKILPDTSANLRLAMLGPIWQTVKNNPIIGNGLGETIAFQAPVANEYGQTIGYQPATARSFDWGYLEMWSKWGLIGLILFLLIIFDLIKNLKQSRQINWLAVWLALIFINLTTPILFHSLGVFLLTITAASLNNEK